MKKMVLVITLAAIALSGSAFAQDPAFFDNIGIYMDEAATDNCATLPIGTANAFLVLNRLTSNEVLAWEAKLSFTNLFMTGLTLRGDTATDLGSRTDEHIVGLSAPLMAVGGAVVLADVALFVPDDGTGAPASGAAFAGPIFFSLLDNGLPAYLDGANDGHAMYPVNSSSLGYGGTVDDPIFIVNGDCSVVANEDLSFGSVKSLFR